MTHKSSLKGRLLHLAAVFGIAAGVVAIVAMTVLYSGPATAETPAERCKRETAAYNNAWKHTWAQANPGKSPSDAPKPPVPYKCGGDGGPPPTLPPTSTTPEVAPETTSPTATAPKDKGSGPSLNGPTDRRDIEHPGAGQPTIGRKPTAGSRDDPKRAGVPRRHSPSTSPASPRRNGPTKSLSRSGVLGYKQAAAVRPPASENSGSYPGWGEGGKECPDGYKPIESPYGCFGVLSVTDHYQNPSDELASLSNQGNTSATMSWSQGSSTSQSTSETRTTTVTTTDGLKLGSEQGASGSIPGFAEVSGKLSEEYSHSVSTSEATGVTNQLTQTVTYTLTNSVEVAACQRKILVPEYIRFEYEIVKRWADTGDNDGVRIQHGYFLVPRKNSTAVRDEPLEGCTK